MGMYEDQAPAARTAPVQDYDDTPVPVPVMESGEIPPSPSGVAAMVAEAINLFKPADLSAELSKRSPVRPVVTLVDAYGRWYRLIIEPSAPEPMCGVDESRKDTPRGESTTAGGEGVTWIERQSGAPYEISGGRP